MVGFCLRSFRPKVSPAQPSTPLYKLNHFDFLIYLFFIFFLFKLKLPKRKLCACRHEHEFNWSFNLSILDVLMQTRTNRLLRLHLQINCLLYYDQLHLDTSYTKLHLLPLKPLPSFKFQSPFHEQTHQHFTPFGQGFRRPVTNSMNSNPTLLSVENSRNITGCRGAASLKSAVLMGERHIHIPLFCYLGIFAFLHQWRDGI